MLFIRFPFYSDFKILDSKKYPANVDIIKRNIASYLGTDQFTLLCNGKPLYDGDVVPDDSNIHVTFSLPGGKGGFGSMLRTIGAQIEKTTNREACRDLSGRRLRDINEEQRLKKWIAKEAEREAEKIRRRKERIERLKNKAPHKFFDFEYEKEISELPTRINDALSEGLQKAKQPAKRPLEKPEKPIKKTWLADDFPASSSDSELEETATDASPSKKQKLAQNVNASYDSDISESSQSLASSSRDSYFDENSASCDSKTDLIEKKYGESSQLLPSSSKDNNSIIFDDSSASYDSKISSTERKSEENNVISSDVRIQDEQTNSNEVRFPNNDKDTNDSSISNSETVESAGMDIVSKEDEQATGIKDAHPVENIIENDVKNTQDEKDVDKNVVVQQKLHDSTSKKDSEEKDNSPIDLFDYQNVSELEALGLDRLKTALMARGLKCGGTLNDRAQRLWKVRGLQPHEYPANLLAKNKK